MKETYTVTFACDLRAYARIEMKAETLTALKEDVEDMLSSDGNFDLSAFDIEWGSSENFRAVCIRDPKGEMIEDELCDYDATTEVLASMAADEVRAERNAAKANATV